LDFISASAAYPRFFNASSSADRGFYPLVKSDLPQRLTGSFWQVALVSFVDLTLDFVTANQLAGFDWLIVAFGQ
jgi:hypothetical protein